MKSLSSVLPLIVLVGAFWLLVLRPNKKRQSDAIKLRNSLSVGQRVVTTSGMLGTIVGVTDEHFELEIAPGVKVTWLKGAIARAVASSDGEGA